MTFFNSQRGLLVTTDYLLKAVVHNCHIYNYLMLEEQEIERNNDQLTLSLVTSLPALSSGTTAEEWEKQQLLLQREEKFTKDKTQLLSICESTRKEERDYEKTTDNVLEQLLSEGGNRSSSKDSTLNKAVNIVTQVS